MDEMNDIDSSALEKILGDMDNMEGQRVYGDKPEDAAGKGVTVTIDVAPKGADGPDHEEAMCKGGCAYHKGGVVEAPEDDSKMPPFLRKLK